jgi:hypothetical protein
MNNCGFERTRSPETLEICAAHPPQLFNCEDFLSYFVRCATGPP